MKKLIALIALMLCLGLAAPTTASASVTRPDSKKTATKIIHRNMPYKTCKKVPVKYYMSKPNKSYNNYALSAFTAYNYYWYKGNKKSVDLHFEWYATGFINNNSRLAKSVARHECGHVLAINYENRYGTKKFRKQLVKAFGGKKYRPIYEEYIADCMNIAMNRNKDTREGYYLTDKHTLISYWSGYGHSCKAPALKVARHIIKKGR